MENLSLLHQVCLSVFNEVAKTTMVFVLPLFIGRIVFANILGEGSQALATIKAAVLYFCLVAGFPLILDILFSIPESYLPKLDSLVDGESAPDIFSSGIIPFALDQILEVLLAALYWLVYYLHIFFMLLMCSMAPVVFLTSTLLGVGLGIEIFLGLIIIGSSWPIIWFGFDQVHTALVAAQSDGFGAKCLELLLTLFKGLSPLAFASMAVKSPAGQVITKAAQAGLAVGKLAVAPSNSYRSYSSYSNSNKSKYNQFAPAPTNLSRARNFANAASSGGSQVMVQASDRLFGAKKSSGKTEPDRTAQVKTEPSRAVRPKSDQVKEQRK